jgi:hypothetical protein
MAKAAAYPGDANVVRATELPEQHILIDARNLIDRLRTLPRPEVTPAASDDPAQ